MSIYSTKVEQNQMIIKIRMIIKYGVSIGSLFIIFMYMIKFIEVSYRNYGKRFFSLWYLPISLMFVTNLFVVESMMILIYTFVLHIWGIKIYSLNIFGLRSRIIKMIIPIELISIHMGILEFRKIYDKYSFFNK